jgi:FlaA1/EpsC-like NDP-sugar epimerase
MASAAALRVAARRTLLRSFASVLAAWTLQRRQAALLLLDALAAGAAVALALWARFEGDIPLEQLAKLPRAVLLVASIRVACNAGAGLHLWSFRLAGLADAVRVVAAGVGGTACFALGAAWLVPGELPRSVYLLEFFLSTTATGALRFGPRAVLGWAALLQRRAGLDRAVIVGDGGSAELLARDLQRTRGDQFRVVGFVGASRRTVGAWLAGRRVLGTIADLPRLLTLHRVTTVFLAERCTDPAGVRRIVETCARSAVRLKVIPPSLDAYERLSVQLLDAAAPSDVLGRDSVAFDEVATRGLVSGRRALVTGAGGSIGSELCRQLARYGARQLVMVDLNENELYLGARRLAERHPELDVRVEVGDVRDPQRLRQLGAQYHPQDVFHAAAHKHVPLMEVSPEEAVKNNVFGSLHTAAMAHACGAERFVLISTDKAVKPSSVMGATKRVAELVVRDLGRSSPTHMAAVRFGNVLGSAGSVVPLFKEQIARGGPVTVTHPDCTRYFMTIPEAVALTLLAGLGRYGDLCVLDMGEPVRIADLAQVMIALAGRTGDIPVVFTGLRPGEKLSEELLTEEEEQSQVVRDRIRVTRSPPPPPDLARCLDELRRHAEEADREALVAVLRQLVPTFQPAAAPRLAAEPRPVVSDAGGAPPGVAAQQQQ